MVFLTFSTSACMGNLLVDALAARAALKQPARQRMTSNAT
jgi:hypothetical protein